MKQLFSSVFLVISIFGFSQNYSKHVNPFIGSGEHGHTSPRETIPFGMVQLSADTRIYDSWKTALVIIMIIP